MRKRVRILGPSLMAIDSGFAAGLGGDLPAASSLFLRIHSDSLARSFLFGALPERKYGLVGVLLLKLLRRPEAGFGLGGLTDGFDFGGADRRGAVAEGIANIGENGGHFLVVQKCAKLGHRNKARILFAPNFNGAVKPVEREFDKPFGVSIHPIGLGKRGKTGGGKPVAVGLMAGDAMAVAPVDFGALIPKRFASGRKMNRRSVGGLF